MLTSKNAVFSLVIVLLVIIVLGNAGTKFVIAEQLYEARWGAAVDLPSMSIPQDTQVKQDTKYGAVSIFSVGGFQWDIQKTIDQAVSDATNKLSKEGYTPLYLYAKVENLSCTLGYCQYGVRLTTQFQTPANQQEILTYVIIAIILLIILILVYFVYKGTTDTVQFLQTLPGIITVALIGGAIIAFSIAIVIAVRISNKRG